MSVDLASGPRAAMVGQTVSHYRVLRVLGAGGMGDVYEAEDLNLGRRVALKFLTSARVPSRQAVQRLEREARAASALNHPHICTIFDIGEHQGDRFIAMERLEGETLRDRLRRGPLDASTLLDVGIQIAGALEAAHRAHIVHRDVSPSNVFLARDHHAKLLDFGLATLEPEEGRPQPGPDEVSTTTEEPLLTSPGAIVGTVAYMSPEQVRGGPVDHRTDLFSFGAVLYEMATGHRAFPGKTSALIFDAILHEKPPPLAAANPAVSEGLQAIVEKALEKDAHLRYQHAEDLRTDLERLRRHVDGPHPSPTPVPVRLVWKLVAVATAVAAIGIAAYVMWPPSDRVPDRAARQLTSAKGVQGEPAISPDGRLVAFTSDEGGSKDVWVVGVRGGSLRQLTNSSSNESHPTWFPDGRRLAFASNQRGQDDIWWTHDIDQGDVELLVSDASSPAVSPDGTQIAFVRTSANGYTRVAVAPVSDPSRTTVLTTDRDGLWDHESPSWSPDGRRIVYATWSGLWLVPASGGQATQLTSVQSDGEPAWSPDGRHVYYTTTSSAGVTSISRVRLSDGVRQPVTLGSGTERAPDVSRNQQELAFSTENYEYDVVMIDRLTNHEASFGSVRDELMPTFAGDGRAVFFVTNRSGAADVWRQPLAEYQPIGNARPVISQPGLKTHPAGSPDGRWLAYYQVTDGRRDVWIAPVADGAALRITDDGSSFQPSWAPDGSAVLYVSELGGSSQIWTRRLRNGVPDGQATQVTSGFGPYLSFPVSSPDGSRIACIIGGPMGVSEVGIVPRSGGRVTPLTKGAGAARARWSGSNDLLFVAGSWGHSSFEVRAVRAIDGAPRDSPAPLVLGPDPTNAMFDVSPDGRFVVTARGKGAGHVWVLSAQSRRF